MPIQTGKTISFYWVTMYASFHRQCRGVILDITSGLKVTGDDIIASSFRVWRLHGMVVQMMVRGSGWLGVSFQACENRMQELCPPSQFSNHCL